MTTHPRVAPVDHAIGMNAYACAMFVESVISASMLFMTPMLPFRAPFKLRLGTGKKGPISTRRKAAQMGNVQT